jgi:hypothetical protein
MNTNVKGGGPEFKRLVAAAASMLKESNPHDPWAKKIWIPSMVLSLILLEQ